MNKLLVPALYGVAGYAIFNVICSAITAACSIVTAGASIAQVVELEMIRRLQKQQVTLLKQGILLLETQVIVQQSTNEFLSSINDTLSYSFGPTGEHRKELIGNIEEKIAEGYYCQLAP